MTRVSATYTVTTVYTKIPLTLHSTIFQRVEGPSTKDPENSSSRNKFYAFEIKPRLFGPSNGSNRKREKRGEIGGRERKKVDMYTRRGGKKKRNKKSGVSRKIEKEGEDAEGVVGSISPRQGYIFQNIGYLSGKPVVCILMDRPVYGAQFISKSKVMAAGLRPAFCPTLRPTIFTTPAPALAEHRDTLKFQRNTETDGESTGICIVQFPSVTDNKRGQNAREKARKRYVKIIHCFRREIFCWCKYFQPREKRFLRNENDDSRSKIYAGISRHCWSVRFLGIRNSLGGKERGETKLMQRGCGIYIAGIADLPRLCETSENISRSSRAKEISAGR